MIDLFIGFLIYVVIVAIVAGIIVYIIDLIPVRQPYNRWAKLAIGLVVALLILRAALPLLTAA